MTKNGTIGDLARVSHDTKSYTESRPHAVYSCKDPTPTPTARDATNGRAERDEPRRDEAARH